MFSNRNDVEVALAEMVAEGMDWDTMYVFVFETLKLNYSRLTDEELRKEVVDFAPHLLDVVDEV